MSGPNSLEYTYRYPFSSQLVEGDGSSQLQLATSQISNAYPYFFEGRILKPMQTALLLNSIAKIATTRFYIPPNSTLLKIERDPVVTAGAGMLRFEGFSACCSTYARVDLTPESYSGEFVGQGCTNVDFNAPMRAALSRMRDQDHMKISVGLDEVSVKSGFERVVERKVELPLRWLKGFVEVQSYQAAMEPRFRVGKAEAIRFLRSLPRTNTHKATFFVNQLGNALRLSQIETKESVPVAGLQRLQFLTDLAPLADALTIYAHPGGRTSEWHLQCGALLFQIAITADISRGFSGEGQALNDLANNNTKALSELRAALKWQSLANITEFAGRLGITEEDVRRNLAILGSRGLVGFDVANRAYFHREMPFDLALVEQMHPRLMNARKLASEGKVRIQTNSNELIKAEVSSSDVQHQVVIESNNSKCTCPWFAKYQNSRGACKHVLAVKLVLSDPSKEE